MALERLSFGDLSQPKEPDVPNPHNTFEGLTFYGDSIDSEIGAVNIMTSLIRFWSPRKRKRRNITA
jgi:hypothetical protein